MNLARPFRGICIGLLACLALCLSSEIQAETLTLDDCIAIALERNVSVANSRYQLNTARQNVWTAWGNWLPQFSASAYYSYREQGGVSEYQVYSPISRTYSKSLSVRQNLFRWGGNYFNVKYNLALRRSSEQSLTQSELETIDLIKNYYFSALKYKGLADVAEQAVRTSEQNLRLVQARFDLGSANQSELLKAKVQLLSNKASFESAKKNRAVGLAQLNNAMNRAATAPLALDERVDTLSVAVDFTGAMAYAEQQHPQILAAEADMQAARYGKLIARSAYLPTVSWNGSRSFSVSDASMWDSFDDSFANWSFGISFSWPIPFFDGFSLKAQNSRASAAHELAKLSLESTINSVGLDIQRALLDINNARANLNLYQESLRSAEEDLEIAQERYNLGAATVLDLLDAEKNLADARNQFVSAKFDFNLAVSALDKAMGKRR